MVCSQSTVARPASVEVAGQFGLGRAARRQLERPCILCSAGICVEQLGRSQSGRSRRSSASAGRSRGGHVGVGLPVTGCSSTFSCATFMIIVRPGPRATRM